MTSRLDKIGNWNLRVLLLTENINIGNLVTRLRATILITKK
jgi:hypothetical protein